MNALSDYNYSATRGGNAAYEPNLRLVKGVDKHYSVQMIWEEVGGNIKIQRIHRGSPHSSSFSNREVTWSAWIDDRYISIPKAIRKHEVSIAKWLVAQRAVSK